MARVSFTVRNNTAGSAGGSYLRYPDGSASVGLFPVRPDYDSALRDDGVQLPPAAFPTSTFTATPITYNTVELEWEVTIGVASLVPAITSTLLVYSSRGIPQTILSGTVLSESPTVLDYTHTGLPGGQWAYYSLFAHFTTSDSSSDYYEKLAELEVLVPTDYGSTLRLWQSLPAYARSSDVALGSYDFSVDIGLTTLNALGYTYDDNGNTLTVGDPIGPLLKFLSIIGFDMDSLRTLIDYLMVAKDPELANSETLDALADMLGLDISVANLGDSRLRAVLDNIGTYRRSKGTLSATSLFVNAVTGSNVSLNNTTKKFSIQSQRANYITNPRTGTGITSWRVAHSSEVSAPQSFTSTAYSAFSADVTLSGQTWTRVSAANGITGAMIKLSSPIPVLSGDFLQFSVHSSTPQKLVWARLVTSADDVVGWGRVVSNINGINYIEVDVPSVPVTLISDTFTRANSTTTLGSTETGQAWTALSGTWGIDTNQAYKVATGGTREVAVVTTGVTDYSVEVKASVASSAGPCWRVVDSNNYYTWSATTGIVNIVTAGVATQLAVLAAVASGDVMKVVVSGTTFNFYRNGIQIGTISTGTSQGATSTVCGLCITSTPSRFDNFTVTGIAPLAPTTFTNCTLEFLVDLVTGPFVGGNYLAEVNYLGDYFDGGTVRGGWLVDASSISDFRWIGSANNSISVYAEDYSRTNGVIRDVLAQSIPITRESVYTISSYNAVRGI